MTHGACSVPYLALAHASPLSPLLPLLLLLLLLDSTRSTATAIATATAAGARGTWLVNIERGKRLGSRLLCDHITDKERAITFVGREELERTTFTPVRYVTTHHQSFSVVGPTGLLAGPAPCHHNQSE